MSPKFTIVIENSSKRILDKDRLLNLIDDVVYSYYPSSLTGERRLPTEDGADELVRWSINLERGTE